MCKCIHMYIYIVCVCVCTYVCLWMCACTCWCQFTCLPIRTLVYLGTCWFINSFVCKLSVHRPFYFSYHLLHEPIFYHAYVHNCFYLSVYASVDLYNKSVSLCMYWYVKEHICYLYIWLLTYLFIDIVHAHRHTCRHMYLCVVEVHMESHWKMVTPFTERHPHRLPHGAANIHRRHWNSLSCDTRLKNFTNGNLMKSLQPPCRLLSHCLIAL